MLYLSDIFKIYVNRKMTKLTLNLNDSETEKLINIEKLTLEKCQSLST